MFLLLIPFLVKLRLMIYKGTEEELTLARRHPNNSEGENLVEKIDKSGLKRSKL